MACRCGVVVQWADVEALTHRARSEVSTTTPTSAQGCFIWARRETMPLAPPALAPVYLAIAKF